MKVSGAVAMADDPGHAFGIYFEKISPGLMKSLPSGEIDPVVTHDCAGAKVDWRRVNDEPFEYAIKNGLHGDEFVQMADGQCLKRAVIPFDAQEEKQHFNPESYTCKAGCRAACNWPSCECDSHANLIKRMLIDDGWRREE